MRPRVAVSQAAAFDAVELGGGQQRGDGRPGAAAAARSGAKRLFLRVNIWGRIARSTVFESSSARPSARWCSKSSRRRRARRIASASLDLIETRHSSASHGSTEVGGNVTGRHGSLNRTVGRRSLSGSVRRRIPTLLRWARRDIRECPALVSSGAIFETCEILERVPGRGSAAFAVTVGRRLSRYACWACPAMSAPFAPSECRPTPTCWRP